MAGVNGQGAGKRGGGAGDLALFAQVSAEGDVRARVGGCAGDAVFERRAGLRRPQARVVSVDLGLPQRDLALAHRDARVAPAGPQREDGGGVDGGAALPAVLDGGPVVARPSQRRLRVEPAAGGRLGIVAGDEDVVLGLEQQQELFGRDHREGGAIDAGGSPTHDDVHRSATTPATVIRRLPRARFIEPPARTSGSTSGLARSTAPARAASPRARSASPKVAHSVPRFIDACGWRLYCFNAGLNAVIASCVWLAWSEAAPSKFSASAFLLVHIDGAQRHEPGEREIPGDECCAHQREESAHSVGLTTSLASSASRPVIAAPTARGRGAPPASSTAVPVTPAPVKRLSASSLRASARQVSRVSAPFFFSGADRAARAARKAFCSSAGVDAGTGAPSRNAAACW